MPKILFRDPENGKVYIFRKNTAGVTFSSANNDNNITEHCSRNQYSSCSGLSFEAECQFTTTEIVRVQQAQLYQSVFSVSAVSNDGTPPTYRWEVRFDLGAPFGWTEYYDVVESSEFQNVYTSQLLWTTPDYPRYMSLRCLVNSTYTKPVYYCYHVVPGGGSPTPTPPPTYSPTPTPVPTPTLTPTPPPTYGI